MAERSDILTIFDFAAGSGMFGEAVRLALDIIGVESVPVGYVEREASAAAAIVAGLEAQGLPRAAVWDDARTFDDRRFRGCVDVLCAGYPCQPFSFAGKRGGESDPRHLWPAVRDAIATIEPGIVFLENVAGHLRLGYGAVERDLYALGYKTFPGLFTAAEVGASHDRKRLFVLAIASGWRPGVDVQRDGDAARDAADGDSCGEDVDGCDSPVADADGMRCGQPSSGGQDGTRSDAATTGKTMAIAAGEGREECLRERRDEGQEFATAERSGGVLADSDFAGPRTGIEGIEADAAERGRDRPKHDREGIPVFPPGPGDLDSWAAIASVDPTRMPAIESDVRGMADGLAPWSERVRMLGNGVVPLAAAYAFLSLFACASEE